MEGRDNQEKLRNYIIQEYEDNGIQMVNLAGDVPAIPYRGFYCYVTSGGGNQEDSGIPADLYYAALDGTWNDDNDNRWGEIGEDDLLPEIGIGRMCFSNQTELDNMLHKSMTYQAEPVLGEFRDVIMGGEHLYDNPLSNGSQYLELLIGSHDDNGYTTTGIPEDYNFTRLYEEQGNWSGTLLRNAINQGTQYVHHDGHANTNYVAGWMNSDITDSNFSGANGVNHNYTFFHTSGCICGDFSSDCILERMTKIANFAVATFGNSRYGWFNEGQTEGPAIHLHRETEDAYYHDRIPYGGMALRESKIETAPWVTAPGQWEEGALRWNFYDLNMMGDVACSPWHDEPSTPNVNYTAEMLVGTTSTTITVTSEGGNPLYNFRCALFHGEDMIGVGYTDEDGNVTIEFHEPIDFVGEMSLIVTGCDVTSSHYTTNGSFAFAVGNVIEDWETGDFSKFEWENDPSKPWTVVTENPYEGSYCAKSGNIGNDMSSVLSITLNVHSEGEVSFYRKVSSEEGYDILSFSIDNELKGEWSGEVAWGQVSYAITPGQHQLYWSYNKDVYFSSGSDCAWLDNIVFPPAETITVTQEIVMNGLTLYPNPNHGQFSINLPEEDCEIVVFNSIGQQVHSQQAKGLTTLNLEGLDSGMYFITVKSANAVTTLKFVKE